MTVHATKILDICEAIFTNPDFEGEMLSDANSIQVSLGTEDVSKFHTLAKEAGMRTSLSEPTVLQVYTDGDTKDDTKKALSALAKAQKVEVKMQAIKFEGWAEEPGANA